MLTPKELGPEISEWASVETNRHTNNIKSYRYLVTPTFLQYILTWQMLHLGEMGTQTFWP